MSLLEFSGCLRYPTGFQLDAHFKTDAQVTAIFGPSASGKTTILSAIAGLRRPDTGRILLGDRILFDRRERISLPPEGRNVGYVFQSHLLFPHLTGRQNLLYGWKRRPPNTASIDFDRVVQVLELGPTLDRLPHTLSGGQCQRIALGRALLCAPQLLLLDEPLASLDAPLKGRILVYVDQVLQEWRIPTLYVTHNTEEVRRLAQWVVVLDQGKVRAAGGPKDVL